MDGELSPDQTEKLVQFQVILQFLRIHLIILAYVTNRINYLNRNYLDWMIFRYVAEFWKDICGTSKRPYTIIWDSIPENLSFNIRPKAKFP